MNSLIKTIEVLKPAAEKKGITIEMDLENAGVLTADRNMISTVLRNLVSNAIKFTPSGGAIEVKCGFTDNHSIITVKDNGIGISEENIQKLTNPEEHFTTYGTDNEKGSGLGSKLVIGFINSHGGELKIKSSIGEGSIFQVVIPYTEVEELVA